MTEDEAYELSWERAQSHDCYHEDSFSFGWNEAVAYMQTVLAELEEAKKKGQIQ